MTFAERTALLYGLALAGAGAVSYFQGKRGQELIFSTALNGAIVGTAFSVVGWLALDDGSFAPIFAKNNPEEGKSFEGMGNLAAKGVALLTQLNPDVLLAPLKESGVKVAPLPANPSIIDPDPV